MDQTIRFLKKMDLQGHVKHTKEEHMEFSIAENDWLVGQKYRSNILGGKVFVGRKREINRGEYTKNDRLL